METFDNIYYEISKIPGKCRLRDIGLGWKPNGGDTNSTVALDGPDIQSAQWSRAAKGYELKILSRKNGTIQLDGFQEDVSGRCARNASQTITNTVRRIRIELERH